jgi:hypothetical protein
MLDRSLVSPDAALPVFCRGARALYGVSSLRALARISTRLRGRAVSVGARSDHVVRRYSMAVV